MDFWQSVAISHRDHVLCNPLSEVKIDELIELLGALEDGRLLDIACGKAEFLCRAVRRWKARAIGVDLSPLSVEDARAKVRDRGLESRIEIVEANAASWKPEPPLFDVAACIGASWIWSGYAGTLEALARFTRPGGRIVIGEPFWIREPSPEHLEATGHSRDSFSTHHGNVEIGVSAGLAFHHALVSSVDDWDRYEGYQWNATESYARENPDDPAVAELLEASHKFRDRYLRWGRDELGWALYMFSRP